MLGFDQISLFCPNAVPAGLPFLGHNCHAVHWDPGLGLAMCSGLNRVIPPSPDGLFSLE